MLKYFEVIERRKETLTFLTKRKEKALEKLKKAKLAKIERGSEALLLKQGKLKKRKPIMFLSVDAIRVITKEGVEKLIRDGIYVLGKNGYILYRRMGRGFVTYNHHWKCPDLADVQLLVVKKENELFIADIGGGLKLEWVKEVDK